MANAAYKITFLMLIVLGMAFYLFVAAGNFPVIIVNYHPISQKEYEATLASVLNYYIQAQEAKKNSAPIDLKAVQMEIKRLALEKSIETALVREEAIKRMGLSFVDAVNKKIKDLQGKESAKNIAIALYGFSPENPDAKSLRPLAERQVLDERLGLENTKLDDWLTGAKKSANVILLIQDFSWYGVVVSE